MGDKRYRIDCYIPILDEVETSARRAGNKLARRAGNKQSNGNKQSTTKQSTTKQFKTPRTDQDGLSWE